MFLTYRWICNGRASSALALPLPGWHEVMLGKQQLLLVSNWQLWT